MEVKLQLLAKPAQTNKAAAKAMPKTDMLHHWHGSVSATGLYATQQKQFLVELAESGITAAFPELQ